MNRRNRAPRMEAVLRNEEERRAAYATLSQLNLTFSEFVRHALCERKLPPHTTDFPMYRLAVRFLWVQYRILNNLRYFKAQARLGRIPPLDMPILEAAITENQQISQAILAAIHSTESRRDIDWMLQPMPQSDGEPTICNEETR
ncbi:hypothetical protein [Leptolyngbya sp. FACHB-16]|uniref:hypothetical protein n=1 Tax=unclassified Leptolyngbya TaxID=2650499 RepID=UPI001684FBA8|nr:hypothetical protein [Leptolyngbya sp. FACHB-16]MBD2157031.1 hypothetical protein [Leptolyngbya sp. FACHB-16]